MRRQKPKILVIVGPTASGKSALAVALARRYGGEVVSADSRQVYRKLNLGTGKVSQAEMRGVPHHLLDVADARRQFSVEDFRLLAEKAIDDILARGKLPILCGGTGFYIQSIVDGVIAPNVAADAQLRKKLSGKSAAQLFAMLKKIDPKRAAGIDRNNKVRMIRSIEIARALGAMPKMKSSPRYDCLQIGISVPKPKLHQKIAARLRARLAAGMLSEARQLHRDSLTWKRMEALGLEYRYMARFLQKKITKEEMISRLEAEIRHYAKRQMQWFKRDKKIEWHSPKEVRMITTRIRQFLK